MDFDSILLLIFVFLLLLIFYEDFRDRSVHLFLFLSSISIGGYLFYIHSFFSFYAISLCYNLIFIIFLLGLIYLYAVFKLKKKIRDVFGFGDVLFFVVLGVSFPTVTFFILFIASLLFSLIIFLTLKSKMTDKTVPLAGLQALFIAVFLVINHLLNVMDIYMI